MKIATNISVTYNDNYKFNEWCKLYEEYKNDVSAHVIADNPSFYINYRCIIIFENILLLGVTVMDALQ